MRLAKDLLGEIDNQNLSTNERALLRCSLAKHQEAAGDFEAAREALGELWEGVGARPNVEGLDEESKAEVLMRAGALTGWLGSASQIEGSQEMAKDLISESIRIFEELGNRSKVGEARSGLALCYWRAGAFDEARVTLQEALIEFNESDVEQRAIALHRTALVETSSKRLGEALRVYDQAAPLFAAVTDHSLAAHFHNGLANVLNQLSSVENREDYVDRALMEYTAASFHFEQAGHERYHVEEVKELLIARALQEAEGSVTKASTLLGFKHHQSLISIINIRHPDLQKRRSIIRKRRHHIFSQSRKTRRIPLKPSSVRRTSPITILHVEDNAHVANLVADMFAEKDWRIELCPEGETALLKLTGDEHYDLLIVDNDLPEMNGLELLQRVRKISDRRLTPIIMLSASDCEREAWRAGVNDFLKKPEQIDELPATVARLLKDAAKHV